MSGPERADVLAELKDASAMLGAVNGEASFRPLDQAIDNLRNLIDTMRKIEAHLSIYDHDDPVKDRARIVARDAARSSLAGVGAVT